MNKADGVKLKFRAKSMDAQVLSDRVTLGMGETGTKNPGVVIDVKSKDGKIDPKGVEIIRGDIPVRLPP